MSNPLKDLQKFGQSPWIDMISREMLDSGGLQKLLDEDGAKGLTSNPSIFEKAIAGGSDYDNAIARALSQGIEKPKELFETIAIADIQDAAQLLLPVYKKSGGGDGFVSLEVSPKLAYETNKTVAEAVRLWGDVDRRNLMIKVPATAEGLPAIAELIGKGINVNVTLIFSLDRYRKVIEAYLEGLETLAQTARPLASVSSVASFFVSRIDAAVEKQLPKDSPLIGKVAIANAKAAYKIFLEVFSSVRFEALKIKGARVQRPLWASTGTKNPTLSDILYVESLIGKDTVNTIPPKTWKAFRDHGKVSDSLAVGVAEAEKTLSDLNAAGVDLEAITSRLEEEGVQAFIDSFTSLLKSIEEKAQRLRGRRPALAEKKTANGLESPAEDVVSRIWDRDASLWKKEAAHRAIIDKSLGWLRMPQAMPERLKEIQTFVKELREGGFQHAVVLGMGGSSLAPEVFRRTLPLASGCPELHVLDSTDPETIQSVLDAIEPEKTLFIVASKSGTTVEPMRFFDFFYGRLKDSLGDAAGKNFIAITDPGSPLIDKAQTLGFRKVFLNFEDIGGRYSALSYFGLVPAAIAGVDVQTLLERAHKMADACALKTPDNPGYRLGIELARHARAGRDKVQFLLPPELETFGLWIEQLLAESTGKENLGVVPITGEPPPAPERAGEDRVYVTLRLKAHPDKSLDAAAEKLKSAGIPLLTFDLEDAYDMGAEFFRWEFATAVLGCALGINPFDQPNVQTAKEKTVSLLASFKGGGSLPSPKAHVSEDGLTVTYSSATLKAVGEEARNVSLDVAVTRFLKDSQLGDYAGVLAYICSDGRYAKSIRKLQRALRSAGSFAVQTGYGPRYLHSTGQLHKGGGNNGLFFVIIRTDGPDLEIPGREYTFAQLVSAQALGDFQALDENGRRALFIRITGPVDGALARLTSAVEAAASAAMKV